MAMATVFRDCWDGPVLFSFAVRRRAPADLVADLAPSFRTFVFFELLKIQKWPTIWLRPASFVKEQGQLFVS
jgi:hypothetical protein